MIVEAARSVGMSTTSFVRLAALRAARKPHRVSRWQEIQVMPRGDHTIEDTMAWILARRPSVADLAPSGGRLDPEVRRALYLALPRTQASRMERRLLGHDLDVIGAQDGCSKQAVHASLLRAVRRLQRDQEFHQALRGFLHERHVAHLEQ